MRPSSCTGQVLGHTTAPGPLVTGPTAAVLSRALLNVSMPLLGRDRALTTEQGHQISMLHRAASLAPGLLYSLRA